MRSRRTCLVALILLALALIPDCKSHDTVFVNAATGAIAFFGSTSQIDVVDVDTMTLIDTIPAPAGYRLVLTPDETKLYGVGGGSMVYVMDAVNFTVITQFDPSAGFPNLTTSELEALAMSPDGSTVYAVDESADTAIFVIDVATDTVIDAAALPLDEPENAVVSPDGAFVYVVDNSVVAKVDASTLTVVSTAPAPADSHGVAINGDGTKIYVDNAGVEVIDAATMTTITTVMGAGGYYLEASRDGNTIYGVDESQTLSVIDVATDTGVNVPLNSFSARGVEESPDGNNIMVATSLGAIRVDAATLTEVTRLSGSYRSVRVRSPIP